MCVSGLLDPDMGRGNSGRDPRRTPAVMCLLASPLTSTHLATDAGSPTPWPGCGGGRGEAGASGLLGPQNKRLHQWGSEGVGSLAILGQGANASCDEGA